MIRRFFLARRITEPGCGRCGYPVRGLVGKVCPECGANQADVGVVQPVKWWRGWGTLAWLVAWGVVVVALAIVGNGALLEFMPGDISNQRLYALHPRSGLYQELTIARTGYGWGWLDDPWIPRSPKQSVLVMMAPAPAGGHYITEFDVSGDRFYSYAITHNGTTIFSHSPTTSGPPLAEAHILEWMSRLDIDTARADVRTEAAELLRLLRAPDFGETHHQDLKGFTVATTVQEVHIARSQGTLTAAWVVVGVFGILLILVARRRVRRHPAGPTPRAAPTMIPGTR